MPDAVDEKFGRPHAPGRSAKRVAFFVCGVQKGGTTSLDAYLREHPELSGGKRKELHFFDKDERDWTKTGYRKLHEAFPEDDGERLRFDVTPIYCYWPPVMERIKAYNKRAKLIFLFRDPFERAWSQYCMEVSRKKESLPFAQAIREGRKRLEQMPPQAPKQRVYSYVERGFYSQQIERALQYFPREQMLFLRWDEFAKDHAATLRKISEFLGIAPFADTGVKRKHTRPETEGLVEPTADDLKLATRIFRDDITRFEMLTGFDVSDWPSMRV